MYYQFQESRLKEGTSRKAESEVYYKTEEAHKIFLSCVQLTNDTTYFQRRVGNQIWDMKKRWGNNSFCLGHGGIQVQIYSSRKLAVNAQKGRKV